MLDQHTDRMWFVIGALVVGAGIILLANNMIPEMFAKVTGSMETVVSGATKNINSEFKQNYVSDSTREYTLTNFYKLYDLTASKNDLLGNDLLVTFEAKQNTGSTFYSPHAYLRQSEKDLKMYTGTFSYPEGKPKLTRDYQEFSIVIKAADVPKNMSDIVHLSIRKDNRDESMSIRNVRLTIMD